MSTTDQKQTLNVNKQNTKCDINNANVTDSQLFVLRILANIPIIYFFMQVYCTTQIQTRYLELLLLFP